MNVNRSHDIFKSRIFTFSWQGIILLVVVPQFYWFSQIKPIFVCFLNFGKCWVFEYLPLWRLPLEISIWFQEYLLHQWRWFLDSFVRIEVYFTGVWSQIYFTLLETRGLFSEFREFKLSFRDFRTQSTFLWNFTRISFIFTLFFFNPWRILPIESGIKDFSRFSNHIRQA